MEGLCHLAGAQVPWEALPTDISPGVYLLAENQRWIYSSTLLTLLQTSRCRLCLAPGSSRKGQPQSVYVILFCPLASEGKPAMDSYVICDWEDAGPKGRRTQSPLSLSLSAAEHPVPKAFADYISPNILRHLGALTDTTHMYIYIHTYIYIFFFSLG